MAEIRIKEEGWIISGTYSTKDHTKFIVADNIMDQMKLSFFMENFDKITQSELERLLLPKEVQVEFLKEDDGFSPYEFDDDELIDELEERKYFVFRPRNINEEMFFEELKKKYR